MGIGLGMAVVTDIPANTRALFHQGNIVSSKDAKTHPGESAAHLTTVKHTECKIDGNMETLSDGRKRPNVEDVPQSAM